ncbi:MAG: histidine kinase [Pseudomonadota bacterium]
MVEQASTTVPISKTAKPWFATLITSNVWTLGAVIVTWATVAVIATTTAFIAIQGNSIGTWLQVLQPMLLYYGVWAACSVVIYYIVETMSVSTSKRLLSILVHLIFLLIILAAMPFLVHFENWRLWAFGARAPGFHTLGTVIYLLNLGGSYLIRFYRLSAQKDREARDARLRSSLLENQLNLARMDALKMQLNPHFLFNALNSIAALIETSRNVEAYHTTEMLGGLLRSVLDQSSDRFLSIEQEIEFLQRYVDLEKVRFGARFNFEVRLSDNCSGRQVPALILQPLIENAIKHGVNPSASPVTIELVVEAGANNTTVITVRDTGPGMPHEGKGIGLENIRKRLDLLFGDSAKLDVANHRRGGVIATLTLPDGPPSVSREP